MRLVQNLTAILAVSALLGAGAARADDSALNKEGVWTVGRGDAKSESCMASAPAESGMLILQATAGRVTFGVGTKTRQKAGKKGVLAADAYRFAFTPALNGDRTLTIANEDLDDRAVAALKLAKVVVVEVEGRELLNASVEGSGLESAIEAMVACSKGEAGWWGPGVEAPPVVATEANDPGTEPALHKDGLWRLSADGDVCSAVVPVQDGGGLVIMALNGGRDVVVGASAAKAFKRGRKGRLETQDYAFDFKPAYEGADYLQLDRFLDSEGFLALRRATSLRIAVDGREEVNVVLEGSGFPDVFASLLACARGETGWWGDGAALR